MPGGHLASSPSSFGPAKSNAATSGSSIELNVSASGGAHTSSSQRLHSSTKSPTNGYNYLPGQEPPVTLMNSTASLKATTSGQQQQQQPSQLLSNKELGNLIDLMPPLSIDHETKRLILAKKLDRENLDKYLALTNSQYPASYSTISGSTSGSSSNSGASSSASLTVHVKCQLRRTATGGNGTTNSKPLISSSSSSVSTTADKNSILIPIHLIVTDENDNWPIFVNAPYIVDLNETAQVGSLLPNNEIVAVDHDQQGPLSTIEYSIVPGSLYSDSFSFLNPLDSRSLIVKDTRYLDYESQSKVTLKIMARDQGEPPNWAITSLYLNLFDQDDLNPMFTEDKYFAYLKDNKPGEVIDILPKRLMARDGDKTINSPVVYSFHLKTNQSIHFDLDQDLGILKLKKSMPISSSESPQQQQFCLLVRATQVDNPRRWSLSAINMRLSRLTTMQSQSSSSSSSSSTASMSQDQSSALEHLLTLSNEAAALAKQRELSSDTFKFSHSNYTVEISELAPVGFTVLNVRATFDRLRGETEGVSYQLLDDNSLGYFRLDESTGRLTLNRSLDYELYRSISVRVLATLEQYDDNHLLTASQTNYPKLQCDITRVTVQIISQNEFAPEFSHEQYNFQLSISDLIANFEPPTLGQQKSIDSNDLKGINHRDQRALQLTKRSGDLISDDLSDSSSTTDDPLGYRAMQLGQIYCADRDFGDKITLKLSGPKANLFHLTQDGRLYLPLTNLTSLNSDSQDSQVSSILSRLSGGGGGGTADGSTWPSASKTISSQFVQSKFASGHYMRRHDSMLNYQAEVSDRKHLNYLLSELSNLGRLRLKVHASDDGQPEARHSTSIIVVSVISIDNFILQQAPPLTTTTNIASIESSSSPNSTDETSGRSISGAKEGGSSVSATGGPQTSGQLMVISTSSGNGKGFVQINPDIIGNLFNNRSAGQANQQADHMQSSGSSLNLQTSSFQSPSLLLVDDEGAKFVAMPAAVEAYSKQVIEASEQMAAANRRSMLASQTNRASGLSLWNQVKSWFGFGSHSKDSAQFERNLDGNSTETRSSLYWLNLSTAILLHLIVIALILTLLVRSRSSYFNGGSSVAGENLSGGRLPRWPAHLIPEFLMFKRHLRRSNHESPIGILTGQVDQVGRINSSYGQITGGQLSSGGSSNGSSSTDCSTSGQNNKEASGSYAFVRHQQLHTSNGLGAAMKHHQSISKGVVVSAMSRGNLLSDSALTSSNLSSAFVNSSYLPDGETNSKAANLLGHLKVTLNKMLDNNSDDNNQSGGACIDQVTVRALDPDCSFDYGSGGPMTRESPKITAQLRPNIDLMLASPSSLSGNLDRGKSSTFIGNQQSNQLSLNAQHQMVKPNIKPKAPTPLPATTTLVSQTTSAPKTTTTTTATTTTSTPAGSTVISIKRVNTNPSPKLSKLASSSSSSAVSLTGSTSSSISNKINAGLRKPLSVSGNQDQANSDISSVDSASLFNDLASSTRSANSDGGASNLTEKSKLKFASIDGPPVPPPPPPPPPPSLSQVSTSGSGGHTDPISKPFSAPPSTATASPVPSNKRRPLPQNPVHARLRQQAASQQQQQQQLKPPAAGTSQPEVAGELIGPNQQQQLSRQRSKVANLSLRSQTQQQQQQQQMASLPENTKTVSPTTSVDRGYESFQSYTFSSQQQQQPQHQNQHMPPAGPSLPPPPPPPPPAQQSAAAATQTAPDSKSSQKQRHLATCPESSLVARSRHLIAAQERSGSKTKRTMASQLPRSNIHSRPPVRGPSSHTRTPSQYQQQQHQVPPIAHDCETEDDDFYYCYNRASESIVPPIDYNIDDENHDQPLGDHLLSDYASHAYQTNSSQHHHLDQCDEVQEIMQTLHQKQIRFQPLPTTAVLPSAATGGGGYASFGSLGRNRQAETTCQSADLKHRTQRSRRTSPQRARQATGGGQSQAINRTWRGGQYASTGEQSYGGYQYHHHHNEPPQQHRGPRYSASQQHQHQQTKKQLTWSDQVDVA